MKILFVTSFYPYPPNVGGKTTLYNLLKHLSKYHDITLLSFFNPKEDIHSRDLKDYCTEVVTVEKKTPDAKMGFIKAISPFSMPYTIRARYEPSMHERLTELVHAETFDIILYVFTQCAVYIQSNISVPQVLMEEDISYLKAKWQSNITPWRQPLLKLINYAEYLRIHRVEAKAWNKADAIIAVTEADKEKIKQVNPNLNVAAIVRGVDFEYYKPDRKEEELNDQVLFLGAAQNTLNIDGVRFFLQKVWPLILSKKPTATFKIVGTGFGNIFDKTKHKNVEEVGFVEDVRPHFDSSKIFVVPLLNGGGLRVKILEAMAMGCPIVTTAIGYKGIDLIEGKDAFVRDDAGAFADAVLTLMDNTRLRCSFSKNVREKVTGNYAWDSVIDKFNHFIEPIKGKQKCICGSENYKKILAGNYNRMRYKDYYFEIRKCQNCGLARTYPTPDIRKAKEDPDYSLAINMAQAEKENIWAGPVVKLAKKYVNSGNLLDIGCFSGKMLEEAEKVGLKAYGVDFYKPAVELGRKRGRNIFLGQIYDAHFKDSFFSCVVINHVFEHILDPLRLIKEINRVLDNNGILIINVPAYESLMRIIMGRRWMSFGPHAHAFFYTKKTLNDIIVKNSELKPVFVHQKGRLEPPGNNWLRNKLKDFIANFATLINKGEQIEAVYIKTGEDL